MGSGSQFQNVDLSTQQRIQFLSFFFFFGNSVSIIYTVKSPVRWAHRSSAGRSAGVPGPQASAPCAGGSSAASALRCLRMCRYLST